MKLFIISSYYPPQESAVGDYVMCLGGVLSEYNIQVEVLTSQHSQRILSKNKLKIIENPLGWGIRGVVRITQVIKQNQPDIINLQYVPQMYNRFGITLYVALLPLILRIVSKITVITTCHQFIATPAQNFKDIILQAIYNVQIFLLLIGSHRIVVPSETQLSFLKNSFLGLIKGGFDRITHKKSIQRKHPREKIIPRSGKA